MFQVNPIIYGIGNPLIDIVITATDADLSSLGLQKGIMYLVDENRQSDILHYFKETTPEYHPGGSAPNTILACSGLGTPSLIAGKIGNDSFGDIYLSRTKEYGVSSGLTQVDGSTGSSIVLVTPDGERTMNTHLGICREFSDNDIDEAKLIQADYLYFTGYMWDTESQKSAIEKAIQISKDHDVKIVFDVADPFAVERNKKHFLKLIGNDVDLLFANQSELAILFDSEDYLLTSTYLMKMINHAGIKLGKKGSLVLENDKKTFIPPRQIKAFDSTGAGDMYAAGFLAGLAKELSYEQSGKMGGLMAEEIIQQSGAQFPISKLKCLKKKLFAD